ncbi:MAG: DUF3127 domain-containing protein [Prevotellaceae bacterium]|nr:DUF3127 domain-containing protein [Candidatus Minthosoma caballi]
MEFTGRIIAVLEARSGVARTTGNPWMMQDYVIEETVGQYPKRMCFNVFGEDKIKAMNIQVGQELTVSFDVNAREYQGRWYNDIRAWKVEPAAQAAAAPIPTADPVAPFPPAQPAAPEASASKGFDTDSDDTSELPF